MSVIEERLAKVEEQITDVKDRVSEMRGHAQTLAELKSMLGTVITSLQSMSKDGFSRCAERSQILTYLTERVAKLEDGQIKDLIEVKGKVDNHEREISALKDRLTPLEKRILIWVGGISASMYVVPYILKMIIN